MIDCCSCCTDWNRWGCGEGLTALRSGQRPVVVLGGEVQKLSCPGLVMRQRDW